MGACVLIPAYNAGATINEVVNECLLADRPVLVVNDGSTDTTADRLALLPVAVLTHPANLGKGAALRTGFAWALQNGYDGVVTIDADGQHNPGAISELIAAGQAPATGIVIASRYSQFDKMAGLRRIWNRFGAWCMKSLTGYNIDDSQSGFRYYSANLLQSVKLAKTGYDLEMEILIKGWRQGLRIISLPVPARVADGRNTSHYRPVRDTWNICMTFLRYM